MIEQFIKDYFSKGELLLGKVVDDYYNYISTVVSNVGIKSEEDKEEIISDVFFIIWKNKNKLNKDLKFSPYIASITKRVAYKKLNLEIKTQNLDLDDFDEKDYISNFKIDSIIEEKELNDIIIKNLEQYSEIDSAIFKMFYIEDKSINQISKITGLTKANVKTKLFRIRKKVKEILKIGGYKI